MAADLPALIARLESGETGREIDEALWLALPGNTLRVHQMVHPKGDYEVRATRDATGRLVTVPSFTTSLDAAVAFTEAVLPGVRLIMTRGENYASAAVVKGWGAKQKWICPTEEGTSDEDLPRLVVLAALKAVKEKVE